MTVQLSCSILRPCGWTIKVPPPPIAVLDIYYLTFSMADWLLSGLIYCDYGQSSRVALIPSRRPPCRWAWAGGRLHRHDWIKIKFTTFRLRLSRREQTQSVSPLKKNTLLGFWPLHIEHSVVFVSLIIISSAFDFPVPHDYHEFTYRLDLRI